MLKQKKYNFVSLRVFTPGSKSKIDLVTYKVCVLITYATLDNPTMGGALIAKSPLK